MDIIEKKLLPAVKKGNLKSVETLLDNEAVKPFFNRSNASKSHERNKQGQYFTKDGFLMIHVAAAHGHTELVKLFLNYFEVDIVNKELETPLMLAAFYNRVETVKFLLDSGANVNHQSGPSRERSVLLVACLEGHGKIVKLLLDRGATIFTKFNSIKSVMETGRREIIDMLLVKSNYKKSLLREALLTAISSADVEMTKMILQYKEKCEGFNGFLLSNGFLAAAASTSTVAIVQLFLNAGVDVNDWSALHAAATAKSSEMVKFLLDKGADPNLANKSNQTALHISAKTGDVDSLKFLLEKGARLDIRNTSGQTPLHFAVKNVRFEAVQILVEQGADINFSDQWNRTALHFAIQKYGTSQIVEFLTVHGADVNVQDISNNTPLLLAIETNIWRGKLEMVKCIVGKGADVNFRDSENQTPLHRAIKKVWCQEIVKLLLEQGANVEATTMSGKSPLDYAVTSRDDTSINYLFDYGADINNIVDTATVVMSSYCDPYCAQTLCKQIVKLQFENLHADARYLKIINNNKKLRIYAHKCKKELDCMKEQKFDDTVISLYDVFVTKDLLQLAAYASNENILNFVKPQEFWGKFPIYSRSIQRVLQKGCHRNFLLKRVCNFFLSLSRRRENKLPRLSLSSFKEIFNYLSNRDLENLRRAYF